jgi:hypothetical protein
MSVYRYIAELNPVKANDLCVKNGYEDAMDAKELSNNLLSMVARNGELALKKIMEIHPDKEAILELFRPDEITTATTTVVSQPKMDSGIVEVRPLQYPRYQNATGNVATQTNNIILVAAVLVSLAIISQQ